ncbi:AAA family ATPase [Brevibacillus humidisoli]|uniref:AAA family ATPase n=1 Tax=Brevibacillus humidisoli TaxID=2895522 RepID=UPI001E52AB05|nr:AAA family ATPase [Brevibacillus humidisoli]UFJ43245.1 AAA family ATPase [Brevibacillus humidisoli]
MRSKEAEPSHRIQVIINHPAAPKQPQTLAEKVRTTAGAELVQVFDELERMIGLSEAKRVMYEIYALLRVNLEREKQKLKQEKQVYHMVFTGNPGTGKTTVARIVGKIFKEMGILPKGHMIEVERADLVGEFIGHTAQKTRDLIKKALGGILFIDEAYSLARGGEKDFGKEAIDCLTKAMEDQRDEFVCILAGYTEEMNDFLSLNPGMPSRFPIQIHFQDYSVEELLQIADLLAADKEYVLSSQAKEKMRHQLIKLRNDPYQVNFSNARYVRNQIEQAIRAQAVRLLNLTEPSREELLLLRAEDFTFIQS